MRVDVYAVDMSAMGCEAAVVSRPGGDRTVLLLEQNVTLARADELISEYLTSEEQAVAHIHCACATPQATGAHGAAHLGGWNMASA